jgi:aryl sulfotransferase
MDSTAWNDFAFRPDDIVIASYMKAGTTWVQQIVSQLLSGGAADASPAALSPWLDFRILDRAATLAALEAQSGRRFIKTHLPADALVYAPLAKYIYVARDGRDVLWSVYHHHSKLNDATYAAINETPGRVGPPFPRLDKPVREYLVEWVRRDGHPYWPFWQHVRSWWSLRDLPNLLLLHHADLKRDLAGEIERIAAFLGVVGDHFRRDDIIAHSTVAFMQANASVIAPRGGASFIGGAPTFFENGGVNGRWRDVLTAEDVALYEETAQRELGRECAAWLAGGRSAAAR